MRYLRACPAFLILLLTLLGGVATSASADVELPPVAGDYACPAGSLSVRDWLTEYPGPVTVADIEAAFDAETARRYLDGQCWAPEDPFQETDPAPLYCPDGWDWTNEYAQEMTDFGQPDVWTCTGFTPSLAWPGFSLTEPTTSTSSSTTTTTPPVTTITTFPKEAFNETTWDYVTPLVGVMVLCFAWWAIWRVLHWGTGGGGHT